jgi:hypothetical protein
MTFATHFRQSDLAKNLRGERYHQVKETGA